MKARFAAVLTLLAAAATLPAAADFQLLNMVMPDAQAMAGVNVEQAKTTPFGQYVLLQMQPEDRHMQEMTSLTGFDPRRDVRELLVATPGGGNAKAGLALARGVFDVAKISATALTAGATVEQYHGVTLVTDPKKQGAFAFPDSTTVVAGAPELVKAALDRRNSTKSFISAALTTKVNELSTSQDAWAVSLVSPSTLGGAGHIGVPGLANQNVMQTVQQASGGVKFGSVVTLNGEAVTATAQDATTLAGVFQFLVSVAQMHATENPDAAALMKALTVSAQGQTVKVALAVPAQQFEGLLRTKSKSHATPRKRLERKRTVQ
jgi:hypothetical protein